MMLRVPIVYGGVAALCLALHNAVLIVADHTGLPLLAGVMISFVLVSAMGYVLHSLLTFRQPMSPLRFGRYALAMVGNIPLAFAATWLWRDAVGLPMVVAAPLASVMMLAVNFIASRWAIAAPGARQA